MLFRSSAQQFAVFRYTEMFDTELTTQLFKPEPELFSLYLTGTQIRFIGLEYHHIGRDPMFFELVRNPVECFWFLIELGGQVYKHPAAMLAL